MLLLRHGVVGFCLGYVPVLTAVVWIAVRVLRKLKAYLSDLQTCSLIYSAVVAFAASVVVGHVIQSPSVSILAVAIYARMLTGEFGKELA